MTMKEGKECILYINAYYIQEIGNVIFYSRLKVFKGGECILYIIVYYIQKMYNQLRYDD
jgi:hypothetical protein